MSGSTSARFVFVAGIVIASRNIVSQNASPDFRGFTPRFTHTCTKIGHSQHSRRTPFIPSVSPPPGPSVWVLPGGGRRGSSPVPRRVQRGRERVRPRWERQGIEVADVARTRSSCCESASGRLEELRESNASEDGNRAHIGRAPAKRTDLEDDTGGSLLATESEPASAR